MRQRRIKLQKAGILNIHNCRRLVEVVVPSDQDTRWQFVTRAHLTDMLFPTVATDWMANFTKQWHTMWQKGWKCFWEGRAYDFRWIDTGDKRYFRCKTKRTMKHGAMIIYVVFDRFVCTHYLSTYTHTCTPCIPIARRSEENEWRVRSATCLHCQAGKNSGFCHHIVVGLEGLAAVAVGYVLAEEVNGGKMHWGLKQSNDERAKVPTQLLAVLSGEECKATYTGTHCPFFEPCNKAYARDLEATLGSDAPQTIVQQLYGDTYRPCPSKRVRKKRKEVVMSDARKVSVKRRALHRKLVEDIRVNY